MRPHEPGTSRPEGAPTFTRARYGRSLGALHARRPSVDEARCPARAVRDLRLRSRDRRSRGRGRASGPASAGHANRARSSVDEGGSLDGFRHQLRILRSGRLPAHWLGDPGWRTRYVRSEIDRWRPASGMPIPRPQELVERRTRSVGLVPLPRRLSRLPTLLRADARALVESSMARAIASDSRVALRALRYDEGIETAFRVPARGHGRARLAGASLAAMSRASRYRPSCLMYQAFYAYA